MTAQPLPSSIEGYQRLLQLIVGSIVDHPDEVKVAVVEGTHLTLFEVNVASIDLGRVIGRSGRTSNALRDLMCTWSAKEHRRLMLDIIEPTFSQDEVSSIPVRVSRQRPSFGARKVT